MFELKDFLLLIFIVTPMFIIALRFWTAPSYLLYGSRWNATIAPLGFIPIFFSGSGNIDMVFLGILVLYMNLYVFFHHIDPATNTGYVTRPQRYKKPDKS